MGTQITFVTFAGWAAAGFLGGIHCLGMCGGLVAALGLQTTGSRQFGLLLAANIGRIASYAAIGALLGGVSSAVRWLPAASAIQTALYVFSLMLLLMLGLYLGGFGHGLNRIERMAIPIWRYLQPYFYRLLPPKTLPMAAAAGALWGLMPCGLVYTAASGALASGSSVNGMLILLAFGLGTLPNLMAMGVAATRLRQFRQQPWLRRFVGLCLIAYALWSLWVWWVWWVAAGR